MIQCEDCEFFEPDPMGNPGFRCDPFRNIKEPACLTKWQIFLTGQMLANYEASSNFQRKIAPLQEKMFKMVEREIKEVEEGDSWKQSYDEDEDEEEQNPW